MDGGQFYHINERVHFPRPRTVSHEVKIASLLFFLATLVTGCMSAAPLQLQDHFPSEAKPSEIIQTRLSPLSSERVPLGMAIVLLPDSQDVSLAGDEYWRLFAAEVKNSMEGAAPVKMEKEILVKDLGSTGGLPLLRQYGRDNQIETIMVVLPSGEEVIGPAKLDLLPEVSLMNGRQIDHHATVELGLVDVNTGKLFMQAQGYSYATLEELDIPIKSNRYPRVRGSAMSTYIYPGEEQAWETLRAVALNEALEQAMMKLQGKWPKT